MLFGQSTSYELTYACQLTPMTTSLCATSRAAARPDETALGYAPAVRCIPSCVYAAEYAYLPLTTLNGELPDARSPQIYESALTA